MRTSILALVLLATAAPVSAQLPAPSQFNSPAEWKAVARDIYKQLIEINTGEQTGSTADAANGMAKRLIDAGIPAADVQVLGPKPTKLNLVARLRGRNPNLKPLLLLAHIDVVEAKREDWSFDPFQFREIDGYFYGRGTSDDKAMAAIFTANVIRMKKEGIVPDRDVILALTADEEGGDDNGVDWLLKNHRELVDAGYGLNEGGTGQLDHGRRLSNNVNTTEKVFLTFQLEVLNSGGHSSKPRKDNAISHLAQGLTRLSQFSFPPHLNETTRTYFERASKNQSGQLARDMLAVTRTPMDAAAAARLSESPYYNALLRTTCTPTMLWGGHAENAQPQMARAWVNCRILPGESPDSVQATLARVIADTAVRMSQLKPAKPSDPSPLTAAIIGPIERITEEMWPGVKVFPEMSTGASDGLYFRNAGIPIYGVSGVFEDINDVRMHGRDERMAVQSFFEGQEFLWRLVKVLVAPSAT